MKIKELFLGVAIVALVATQAGCGGGGSATPGSSPAPARVFATDDLSLAFDHVWVQIKEVDVVPTTGALVPVFSNPTGLSVDLKTLRDSTGARFLLLNNQPLSQGSYTGIKVILDKNVTVFPAGSTSGVAATFAGAGGTDFVMDLNFRAPKPHSASGGDFIIDFDLSKWKLVGSVVQTDSNFLKEGDGAGLNDKNRHEAGEYEGVITNLAGTAPVQTFGLSKRGGTINVSTSDLTVIFTRTGGLVPSLANGQEVKIRGVLDAATNMVAAAKISVGSESPVGAADGHEARGAVTVKNVDSLTINLAGCDGFVPVRTSLNINFDASTVFMGPRGTVVTKDQFLALIVVGSLVEAEGQASEGTMTAKRIKLDSDDHSVGQEAEAQGVASAVNVTVLTFDLTIREAQNVSAAVGSKIHVIVTPATAFENNGKSVLAADFFAAMNSVSGEIEVRGAYNAESQTFKAERVRRNNK